MRSGFEREHHATSEVLRTPECEASLEELGRLDRMNEALKEPCRLLSTVKHVGQTRVSLRQLHRQWLCPLLRVPSTTSARVLQSHIHRRHMRNDTSNM